MMQLTIIGFGNQARAWSQNLQDSGFPVRVALRPESSSAELAHKLGFETVEIGSPEFYQSQALALLTPDQSHHDFMFKYGPSIRPGTPILYAHGFSLLKSEFPKNFPHLQHVLFAPKSIGTELRKQYKLKGKLGAVYSLEFYQGDVDSFKAWLMKLAQNLGINLGPYPSTFQNETQADLYSEQGLLCSLLPYTASEMFQHLVEEGIEPELAYFECWFELKLIANAMVDIGPQGFFDLISPNALIGAEKGFHRLITPEFRQNLRSLLSEIRSGAFNQELDETDVEETRKIIRERWQETPLMKTFRKINQD